MTRTKRTAPKAAKPFQHPEDTMHFRMQQTHGAVASLMWLYMCQSDDEMMHFLSPRQMKDALWGICELTRQGCNAAREAGLK